MPRGSWCILIALAGLGVGNPIDHGAHARAPNRNAEREGSPEPAPPVATQNRIDVNLRDEEASRTNLETNAAEERAQRDLDAQEDMAKWAFWLLLVGIISTVIGIIGVSFIWLTLKATRDAVIEAGEATEAARAAVKATEESAQNQLRAWVRVDTEFISCRRLDTAACFTLRVRAENVGQTPALRVAGDAMLSLHPSIRAGRGELPKLVYAPRDLPSLMPRETAEFRLELKLTNEEIGTAMDVAQAQGCWPVVVVDTVLVYFTIFDTEQCRKTSARHVITSAMPLWENREAIHRWLIDGPRDVDAAHFGRDLVAPVYMS
ncbi:MAG: hypothetical protein H7X93_02945 [Sphingomonadaceae bacterium]|nr:hypothetical protein [Sphingomonadaceae bacterium]